MIPIQQIKKLRLSSRMTCPWALLVNTLSYQVSCGAMQMRCKSLVAPPDPS